MKQKYDLIFSFGLTCACSQTLRAAGLQYTSFPYDWIGCEDIRAKVDFLCDGFPNMLDAETFHVSDANALKRPCWTGPHGLLFPHDLRVGVPLEEQFPDFRAKYARRFERLSRLLGSARRTLAVCIDNKLFPSPTEEDIRWIQKRLAGRWPNAGFEVLFVRHASGVEPDAARITDRPGYRIIDLDCCTLDGQSSTDRKVMAIGRYLAGLLEVVDYRTAEEKREGPRKRRLAKYGKFAAKTFWGYHWNRIQHRLYRHLYNRLHRKGLA